MGVNIQRAQQKSIFGEGSVGGWSQERRASKVGRWPESAGEEKKSMGTALAVRPVVKTSSSSEWCEFHLVRELTSVPRGKKKKNPKLIL